MGFRSQAEPFLVRHTIFLACTVLKHPGLVVRCVIPTDFPAIPADRQASYAAELRQNILFVMQVTLS
jgi:hypothetical protein